MSDSEDQDDDAIFALMIADNDVVAPKKRQKNLNLGRRLKR